MLAPPPSDTKAPMYANGTRRHHHAVRESTQLLVGSVSFSLSDFFPPLSFIFLVDAVYLNILFDLFSYCHILFSLYLDRIAYLQIRLDTLGCESYMCTGCCSNWCIGKCAAWMVASFFLVGFIGSGKHER